MDRFSVTQAIQPNTNDDQSFACLDWRHARAMISALFLLSSRVGLGDLAGGAWPATPPAAVILGIRPSWGMTECRMSLWNGYATTRSDLNIFDGFGRRLLPRRSPHMPTDTSTLPRRALEGATLGHTYASRVADRNRPPPPDRSVPGDDTFAPSAAA